MNSARTQKSSRWRGLSWVVAFVLMWLQVGVNGFALIRDVPHAASLTATVASAAASLPKIVTEHANCFCKMCKGAKKKTCCCAPKAGAARPGCVMTERCDGATAPDTLAAGSPLPLTVLPTLAARALPPANTERARCVFAPFAQPALGRAPTPPHAPPQSLS